MQSKKVIEKCAHKKCKKIFEEKWQSIGGKTQIFLMRGRVLANWIIPTNIQLLHGPPINDYIISNSCLFCTCTIL